MSRVHTHPGAVLREELAERGLSANRLAQAIGLSPQRVREILNEERGVTPDTAIRLAQCLDISAELWLTMQAKHDQTDMAAKPRL